MACKCREKICTMVTSVKIILDTRSKKQDNSSPLKLRIVHDRVSKHISLGHSVLEKDWDEVGQHVKASCKQIGNVTRFNAILHKQKQRALDIISQLQTEGRLETMSFEEIKRLITAKEVEVKTLAFIKSIIARLREANKYGNAKVYETLERSVRTFVKGRDFLLRQLTYTWLKNYEAWYLSKGNSVNGLGVHMRTLRAVYNQAVKQKMIGIEHYPFKDYSIKNEKTRKRAIANSDLELIRAFEPRTLRETRAKDYFLFSFYMMGASFIDLAFLKVKNITGGRIEYKRRKTGHLHSIIISPALQELLDKYLLEKTKEDFILDIIHTDDPQKQLVNVQDELKRYNRSLKQIAEACGIESKLTSYVSRHSYATIAKRKGVPTAIISEALGHSTEEVTQVYLASFEQDVLDKYHAMIIENND